jgi:anti-sigma factor RsiW
VVSDAESCDGAQADLAEMALGVLSGEDRARVLVHLESCERCAADLRALGAVVDELLSDVPEAEPPAGFELGVLRAISQQSPSAVAEPCPLTVPLRPMWSRRPISPRRATAAVVVIAAAAAALVAVSGFLVGRSSSPGQGRVRSAASTTAVGGELRVAQLTSSGRGRGEVVVHGGARSWLLMTVRDLPHGTTVTCEVTTRSGEVRRLGSFWLGDGSGYWSVPLPVELDELASADVVSSRGVVLASATFAAR